jgi:tetratricopeptide (TPR) repeat protein
MPRRRTQDVVRVVMTDHRIQRRPPPGDLLAPLAEHDPEIRNVTFLDRDTAPAGALGDAYRAVTLLRASPRNASAASHLQQALGATESTVPRFDLIAARLQQRQFPAALGTLTTLGAVASADPLLLNWRGIASVGAGKGDAGIADLHAAVSRDPGQPEYHFNLGAVLERAGRHAEALPSLSRAIELRPNFVAAWMLRAETLAALGRKKEAIGDLERALAIDPRQTAAYLLLGQLLTESGQRAEAQRWLRHGARVAAVRQPAETISVP